MRRCESGKVRKREGQVRLVIRVGQQPSLLRVGEEAQFDLHRHGPGFLQDGGAGGMGTAVGRAGR
ncbi:MAG: hypothetical protein R6X27_03695, partial [Candidatus Desulfacyla sp.]